MTRPEAARLVAILIAAFPQSQVTEQTSKVYETLLADLDFETAQAAVHRLARTLNWLPTIAQIRSAAVEVQHGARRIGSEAWGDVVAEIRRVGAYGDPRWSDPTVESCVRALGWRNLCLGQNEAADRARFVELYDGLQERHRLDAVAGRALPPARSYAALPETTVRNVAPLLEGIGKPMPRRGNGP
jgi:hypothetical protein